MCVLFMYVDPNPDEGQYRLIIATNRDEHYKRPAENLRNCEKTGIIGGRDLEPGREGGMWLGVTTKKNGTKKKVCSAVLLNLTGNKSENAQGRGALVSDYLQSTANGNDYIKYLEDTNKVFNGYNFVAAEVSEGDARVYHHSNNPDISTIFKGKQILGFGNSPINRPLNKVQTGRRKFEKIIKQGLTKEELVEQLINLLKSKEQNLPDDELKNRAPEEYKSLSSLFVTIEEAGYGTRAHSVILVDYEWNLEFIEQALEQPINIKCPKWNENVINLKV